MSNEGKSFMMMKYVKETTWLCLAPTPDLEVPGISFHLPSFFFFFKFCFISRTQYIFKETIPLLQNHVNDYIQNGYWNLVLYFSDRNNCADIYLRFLNTKYITPLIRVKANAIQAKTKE